MLPTTSRCRWWLHVSCPFAPAGDTLDPCVGACLWCLLFLDNLGYGTDRVYTMEQEPSTVPKDLFSWSVSVGPGRRKVRFCGHLLSKLSWWTRVGNYQCDSHSGPVGEKRTSPQRKSLTLSPKELRKNGRNGSWFSNTLFFFLFCPCCVNFLNLQLQSTSNWTCGKIIWSISSHLLQKSGCFAMMFCWSLVFCHVETSASSQRQGQRATGGRGQVEWRASHGAQAPGGTGAFFFFFSFQKVWNR